MVVGAAIGTVVGLLVAGALAKLFPSQDLVLAQALLVALGCIIGVVADGTDWNTRRRK